MKCNPQTNSLHIFVGELSVSLWDLHILGGLPIFGKFYDEFISCATKLSVSLWDLYILEGLPIFGKFYDESIPCTAELTGEDELGKRFTPKSCEYLFKAFHTILTNGDKKKSVSIEDWIAF